MSSKEMFMLSSTTEEEFVSCESEPELSQTILLTLFRLLKHDTSKISW